MLLNFFCLFHTYFKGQVISIGNYWRDPYKIEDYKKYSKYLAQLNGESGELAPDFKNYKKNFTKLKKMITIGGPDDDVIEPWQSAFFGNYKPGNDSQMWAAKKFDFYETDFFGLKTLDQSDRWIKIEKSGFKHSHWIRDEKLIVENILPYLS